MSVVSENDKIGNAMSKIPNQQEVLELAEVVGEVLSETEGSIINPAVDVAAQVLTVFKRANKTSLKPVTNDLSIAGTGIDIAVTTIGFLLASVTLWNGLREGGELRPINKNKFKISTEVAKIFGSIVALSLGAAAFFVAPAVASILALVTAGVSLAVSIPRFISELRKDGEFWPAHKNKLKISGAIAMLLGSAIVLGLGAAALAIPGVAPILGVVAAGVGIAVSIHQLFIAVRGYIKAKSDLKELNVLELKSSSPDEQLTNKQQERLNYLQSKHAKLVEEANPKNIRDLIIQGVAIKGGALTAIGLAISLFFPLGGLAFAAVGAAITVTSGIAKLSCVIYDHIQKKREYPVAAIQNAESPTAISKELSTMAPKESSTTTPKESPKTSPKAVLEESSTVSKNFSLRFFASKTLVHTESSDDLKNQKPPTIVNK